MDAARATTVEEHIRQCPACAAELAQLRSMSQWFAEGADSPSLGLSQMSLHRLYAKTTEKTLDLGVLRAARWVSAMAAMVLVASGAWLMQIKSPQAPAMTAQTPIATPPWVDVAVASYTESSSLDTNTPAAAWYLASVQDSGR